METDIELINQRLLLLPKPLRLLVPLPKLGLRLTRERDRSLLLRLLAPKPDPVDLFLFTVFLLVVEVAFLKVPVVRKFLRFLTVAGGSLCFC